MAHRATLLVWNLAFPKHFRNFSHAIHKKFWRTEKLQLLEGRFKLRQVTLNHQGKSLTPWYFIKLMKQPTIGTSQYLTAKKPCPVYRVFSEEIKRYFRNYVTMYIMYVQKRVTYKANEWFIHFVLVHTETKAISLTKSVPNYLQWHIYRERQQTPEMLNVTFAFAFTTIAKCERTFR